MSITAIILIVLVFGAIFYMSGQFLSGNTLKFVQFLCGAIIVVALILFLLGLFGHRTWSL